MKNILTALLFFVSISLFSQNPIIYDEGLIKDEKGQDRWAKGETTAKNERRYVLQMQQGTWDYKSDGIKQLKYELVSVEDIGPNAKIINVKFYNIL